MLLGSFLSHFLTNIIALLHSSSILLLFFILYIKMCRCFSKELAPYLNSSFVIKSYFCIYIYKGQLILTSLYQPFPTLLFVLPVTFLAFFSLVSYTSFLHGFLSRSLFLLSLELPLVTFFSQLSGLAMWTYHVNHFSSLYSIIYFPTPIRCLISPVKALKLAAILFPVFLFLNWLFIHSFDYS